MPRLLSPGLHFQLLHSHKGHHTPGNIIGSDGVSLFASQLRWNFVGRSEGQKKEKLSIRKSELSFIYLNCCRFIGTIRTTIPLSSCVRPCITKWWMTVFANFDSTCIVDAGGVGEFVGEKVDSSSALGV